MPPLAALALRKAALDAAKSKAATANDNVQYRVPWGIGSLIIGVAIMVDVLQFFAEFIPGAGLFVAFFLGVLGYAILFLWFALRQVSFATGKKALAKILTTFMSAVIEFLPLLDALPMTTVNTVFVIIWSRAEDRDKAKEDAEKAVAAAEVEMQQAQAYAAQAARMEQQAANENAAAEAAAAA
jgi:hypothetical protein